MTAAALVPINASTSVADAAEACRRWLAENLPAEWAAAARRGPDELRRARPRSEYERWYPTFGASGLVVPTWEVEHGGLGVSREVARCPRRRARPVPTPSPQPARLEQRRCRIVRPRHRGPAATVPATDGPERGAMVPTLQRARSGVRPCLARLPGQGRRRSVDRHRAEGLDHLGQRLGLRDPPGADQRRRSEAQRPHLLVARPAPTRGDHQTPAPDHRRGGVQRGLPRRGEGPRCPSHRSGRRWLEGQRIHAVLRAADGVGFGLGGEHRTTGRHRLGSGDRTRPLERPLGGAGRPATPGRSVV